MLKIQSFILLPEYQINTYLLWDDNTMEAILIDPSAPDRKMADHLSKYKVKMIINTHGHGDHIGGNPFFKNLLQCPIAIHSQDAKMLIDNKKNLSEYMGTPLTPLAADTLLEDNDQFHLGSHIVKVIHTPGHTKGCICLIVDKFLISGDTLFEQSIGRTDFPGGSHDTIIHSIKSKLFILPEDTVVFPGHGPRTSIGMEKLNNPFVREHLCKYQY